MTASEEKRIAACLKKLPLLAEVPGEILAGLAPKVALIEARRGKVFYLPGDPGASVFFLQRGRVKVSKVADDGKEFTLAYHGPGETFGELCALDGRPREEMAEAMESSTVIEVATADYAALLKQQPSVGYRVATLLGSRCRELADKIERLVFKGVNSKLAELLLNLSAEFGVDDDRGTRIGLKITHQEMANLIGATRETVSLTLSQFRRRGLIQMAGRRVIIADRQGLLALS